MGVEEERLARGTRRNGTAEPISRDHILRR